MVGFQKPTRCPRAESITATEPFNSGATKFVPPQPPMIGTVVFVGSGPPFAARNAGQYSR